MRKVILMLCIAVIAAAMPGCDSRNPKGELAKICESENARTPIAMGSVGKCSEIRYDKDKNDVMLICDVPAEFSKVFSVDSGMIPAEAVEPMIMYHMPRTLLDKAIEAGATLSCYVYADGTDDFFCSITFSPDEDLPSLIERSAPVKDDGTALSRINRFVRGCMANTPSGDNDDSGNVLLSVGVESDTLTYTFVYYDDSTLAASARENFSTRQNLFDIYYANIGTFLPEFEGSNLTQDMIDASMNCAIKIVTLADNDNYTITLTPVDFNAFLNSAK